MKYLVIVPDGAGGEPLAEFGGKTTLETAHLPTINDLAGRGEIGLVTNVPSSIPPGSDAANMNVLGYDPTKYLQGRSSLEAESMDIPLENDDVSYRVNLVTLEGDGNGAYEDLTMADHSAGEIETEAAAPLIDKIRRELVAENIKFYPGVSYRNILVEKGGEAALDLTPPHDILERRIGDYLPKVGSNFRRLMERSHEILSGDWNKTKANSIWIWGAGRKTTLPSFTSLHGLAGSVISAVDLNRGIAKCADMKIVDVEGATGRMDTNFEGKADAAIAEFESGTDFVYLHIEAPDEASHKGDAKEKIAALEMVDTVVKSAVSRLDAAGERYRLLIVPDHRTPIRIRTHSHDPVPFLIYDSEDEKRGDGNVFSEKCGEKGKRFESGRALLKYFLGE